ncbi:GntR family transcriptional regulator [Rhodobacterales bacterium HKCCE3408]|nr:GntR family transcriptional regulator [Rhodobacterales bacterium HKCCE3408]
MARVPKYQAAEVELRRRISSGDWPPGTRLGNEFQLADEFDVSQGTMRRALMTLEAEGLLNRKPGRGTIVADPREAPKASAAAPVTLALRDASGRAPAFAVHRAKSAARGPDATEMALFGSGGLLTMERILKIGDARAAVETIRAPEACIPELDEDGPVDFAAFLADHGLTPASVEVSAAARMTTMGESVTLSCDRNTALLVVTSTAIDGDGTALARQDLLIAAPGLRLG